MEAKRDGVLPVDLRLYGIVICTVTQGNETSEHEVFMYVDSRISRPARFL